MIPQRNLAAEAFHKMLLDVNPEGYELKRISVFENPIRANLEFCKARSKQRSVFELQVSLTSGGDELLYCIDTAKSLWRLKTMSFTDMAEQALKKVVYG